MSKIIGEFSLYWADKDDTCDCCNEAEPTWVGLEFQGTAYEPPEYIYVCDECASR